MKAIILLLICIALITPALADNCTNDTCTINNTFNPNFNYNTTQAGDQLSQFSQNAKSFNDQVKAVVPYEVFEGGTILFAILYMFSRGGHNSQNNFFKVGLYVAIAIVVAWFLLTR